MKASEILMSVLFAAVLALPVACASWTVTMEYIFQDLRKAATAWGKRNPNSYIIGKLSYLPTCYYCFSHWVAFVALVAFPFKMLTDGAMGYIPALFTTVFVANVYMSIFNILRAKLRMQRGMADEAEIKAKIVKSALSLHSGHDVTTTTESTTAPMLAS